jgi:hypothetical protein
MSPIPEKILTALESHATWNPERKKTMSEPQRVNRRDFLGGSLATVGVAGAMAGAGWGPSRAGAAEPAAEAASASAAAEAMPCGMIGKAKISRLLLGAIWSPAICTPAT